MQEVYIYIDDFELPVNPYSIKYKLPISSVKYDLITKGEAEMLKGSKLAEIYVEGYLPMPTESSDENAPSEYIEKINKIIEDARPVRIIYTGTGWDINMLVSMQEPEFYEVGGNFDVEYKLRFRKWVEISNELVKKTKTRESSVNKKNQSDSVYTVKSGDNLSKIAKQQLGSQSKWKGIYEANKNKIGNPNLIYPGQELVIPQGPQGLNSDIKSSNSANNSSNNSSNNKPKNKNSNTNISTPNNNKKPKYNGANDTQIGYGRS